MLIIHLLQCLSEHELKHEWPTNLITHYKTSGHWGKSGFESELEMKNYVQNCSGLKQKLICGLNRDGYTSINTSTITVIPTEFFLQ